MRLKRLVFRNLIYYWRTNLAVIFGVAAAVAVLSGALLVGSSVRASLLGLFYQRLGRTEYVVLSDGFFREDLAGRLAEGEPGESSASTCPIIYLQGVAIREETGARVYNVNVYGVDERFWRFQGIESQAAPESRGALVGATLAGNLGIRAGDWMLLRTEMQQDIPRESLYGRRESVGRTLRLICSEILPPDKLGDFALRPSQRNENSIFVPLRRLQRDLAQPMRANAALLALKVQGERPARMRELLKEKFSLEDAGLELRPLPSRAGILVESTRILLPESAARAAFDAAADAGMKASGIFTYLANSIRTGGREIPYSLVTAADLGKGALTSYRLSEEFSAPHSAVGTDEAIWLNEWAWRDLGVSAGDSVELDYYLWQEDGHLSTRSARFRLAGVVSIGGDVDAALAPDFPGITETRSMRSWDPPFPLDLRRIRPKDEEYWNRYRATPKAFIPLARGQQLWQNRFGKLSSVRVAVPEGMDPESTRKVLAAKLRDHLDPEQTGLTLIAVRERGLSASRGSTDFGEYFLYFSIFLIASGILLSVLFFRLGIEHRVREVGTLVATGYPVNMLRRIFLLEGALLSAGGSVLGLIGAFGYGGLLLFGLGSWWIGAVGTRHLRLHSSAADLASGAAVGILASLAMIVWTLSSLRRNSPRSLLAGVLESASIRGRRARVLGVVSSVAFLLAVLTLLGSALQALPAVEGFFCAGFLLLVSLLSMVAFHLRRSLRNPISGRGWRALLRLGFRNASHRPGRSLFCISLIASATFIIVSVESFRQDPSRLSLAPTSGTGGFALIADSVLPIVYDPNSAAGRDALGLSDSDSAELAQVRFVPFRVRSGDDASCLNLYAPQDPKILGASRAFLSAGRFSFQESLALTPEQKRNPWLLLETVPQDGSIPAVGDANTIEYILHVAVGAELGVRGDDGTPVRLRLVGALRDSVLQGELVISEANFLRAFPDREGYRFFLLDVPADRAPSVAQLLSRRLEDWGFSAESSRARLALYHRVENTYLSTFQSLGAMGLILGTAGLAAVLLRNVLERRKELALLRAVGYQRRTLSLIIVSENVAMMLCGLVCGTACALLASWPALHARGGPFPAVVVMSVPAAVVIFGSLSSLLAVIAAFRSPLLEALKSE